MFIIVGFFAYAQETDFPFTREAFDKDPVGITTKYPHDVFNSKFQSDGMRVLQENPQLLVNNPNVFQEMVRAQPTFFFSYIQDQNFQESFNKALANNPENIATLNQVPSVIKDWAMKTYDINMQGKIKNFDGTSLITLGEHSTTFNPKDFPGATVLSSGEVKLVKDSTTNKIATVSGGTITKDDSGTINIDGANVNVPLLPKGTLHITNGNLVYRGFRYEAVSPEGFTFNGEDVNTKIIGSFEQYGKNDLGKEFISASGKGLFEFDRKSVLVNPINPGQDFSYKVFDPNDNSRSFVLICSQNCVTEGSPLILDEGTKISYKDIGLDIERRSNHASVNRWGTEVAKVTTPELIGNPGELAGKEKEDPNVKIFGGPVGIVPGAVFVLISNAANLAQDVITMPFRAIGGALCFITKCEDKEK